MYKIVMLLMLFWAALLGGLYLVFKFVKWMENKKK